MPLNERPSNAQVAFGSKREPFCTLAVDTKAGSASGLVLVDSSGVEWVFWVHGGVLRFGTRAQFFTLTGGAVV